MDISLLSTKSINDDSDQFQTGKLRFTSSGRDQIPGTVLTKSPGSASSDIEPGHDDPALFTMHRIAPNPAAYLRNAVDIICAEVDNDIVEGTKGEVASDRDATSSPAVKIAREVGKLVTHPG